MVEKVGLYGQIFHQVFSTVFSFVIFYQVFNVCFKNPVVFAIRLRLAEKNLICSLIEKEQNDKYYFQEKIVFLKKSKKEKIDSYIFNSLSVDEKNWNEAWFQAKLETKNLFSASESLEKIPDEVIESVYEKIKERLAYAFC